MRSFYFLRHALTDANAQKLLCGGAWDIPLNAEGQRQVVQASRDYARGSGRRAYTLLQSPPAGPPDSGCICQRSDLPTPKGVWLPKKNPSAKPLHSSFSFLTLHRHERRGFWPAATYPWLHAHYQTGTKHPYLTTPIQS